MFTQFFGSYLLNQKLLSPEELINAMEVMKSTHVKLGVLAINSGYMSPDEVNQVHKMQERVDKKFGEIAIERGFIDEQKLNILLNTQKSGHLLLGQAIIDKNYMTLGQFDDALENYKKDFSMSNEQFNSIQQGDLEVIINTFYDFHQSPEADTYKNYCLLLLRNIVRFIDNDFTPLDVVPINTFSSGWVAIQEITGKVKLTTAIGADEKSFIGFAGRFAKENYSSIDEYSQAAVGEFLNLVNGLFIVNMSNNNIELELTPQRVDQKNLTQLFEAFSIPIKFSFGEVNFIISRTTSK